MRVLNPIHDPAWTESRVVDALRARGAEVEHRCHAAGDPLPDPDDPGFGAPVVNRGHVSVWQADEHPFMARELAFVTAWAQAGRPYLGICLGAHLLAATAGWWEGNAETRIRPGAQPLDEQLADAERLEPARARFVERLLDLWLPAVRHDGRAA